MATAFECPVCYCSREDAAGTVVPRCKHEICIPCYSGMRDRSDDPSCVLCRRPYFERVREPAAAHDTYVGLLDYRDHLPLPLQRQRLRDATATVLPPLGNPATSTIEWSINHIRATTGPRETEAQRAARRGQERAPLGVLSDSLLRPIVRPSIMRPGLAAARREARAHNRTPLSQLTYRQKIALLRGPAVNVATLEPVAPAAIVDGGMRLLQARILGLRRASAAQQTAAMDQVRARAATRITPTQPLLNPEAREAAAKTFSGFFPPRRGFRIGDTHVRREDGVSGVCTGHYLWTYADGLKVRAQGRQVVIMYGSTPRHRATLVMLGGTWNPEPVARDQQQSQPQHDWAMVAREVREAEDLMEAAAISNVISARARQERDWAVVEAARAVVQAEDRLTEAMTAREAVAAV